MSVATTPARAAYPWPADLLEFARREGVADQLDPILDLTRRLFPTASKIEVVLEQDHELRDVWAIVYNVWLDGMAVELYQAIKRQWQDERRQLLRRADPCLFVLLPSWSKA